MPMPFAGREPDDVAGADLLDRPAVPLNASTARRDDQRLPEWVRVPGGASTGVTVAPPMRAGACR